MDVRERLIELLKTNACPASYMCDPACRYYGFEDCFPDRFADHLIAHGVAMQEWISVKDRLPEEDGKYLVFEQNNGRTNTSILRFAKDARKVDRYDFKNRWKNAWYEYDSEWGHYTVDSITHWMPLPEPPKGE